MKCGSCWPLLHEPIKHLLSRFIYLAFNMLLEVCLRLLHGLRKILHRHGFWNLSSLFFCRINPFLNYNPKIGQCFFQCLAVSNASRQLVGNSEVRSILLAPENLDSIVSFHKLYCVMAFRT